MTRSDENEAVRPPAAPQIRRRFRAEPLQRLGLGALAAIPILALFGIFGQSRAEAVARGRDLHVRVRYVDRFRYAQVNPVHVHVTNASTRRIDTITVAFDTAYVNGFSDPTFTPEPSRAYAVDLAAVAPGETRLVVAALEGHRYGRHTGAITAAAGTDTARVVVSTLVFP